MNTKMILNELLDKLNGPYVIRVEYIDEVYNDEKLIDVVPINLGKNLYLLNYGDKYKIKAFKTRDNYYVQLTEPNSDEIIKASYIDNILKS